MDKKSIVNDLYQATVISVLAVGYSMLGKKILKMTPPSVQNNKKRSHTQLDSRKQVIAFQDRVITINIKEAQHPLK